MPRKYVEGKGYGIILLLSSLCFIFPKFSFDTWTLKSKFSGHRFWLSTQRLTLTKGKKIQLFSFVLTNCKMHHSFWRIVPNDRQKEIHFKRNFFHLILKNHQIWQKFLKKQGELLSLKTTEWSRKRKRRSFASRCISVKTFVQY